MRHFPSPDIGMFGRRQRHVRGHRIPVTITREAKAEPDCAVVVDTFGANDVAPLPGGCGWCTVRTELERAVRQLLAERGTKPFSRAVIETQHDFNPVLRTFMSDKALGGEYYVENDPRDVLETEIGVHRFVVTERKSLSWEAFSRFVTTLIALRGPDLLQMKGLLNVEGCRGPVAVQFMGHLTARPVELQGWSEGECASRLEFVTRGVEKRTVRDLFNAIRSAT